MEYIQTGALIDSQGDLGDTHLVSFAFLKHKMGDVPFEKYPPGEEPVIETIKDDVVPLGFIVLSFDPEVKDPSSGRYERQKSEYYRFDVIDSSRFGDMLLGREYFKRKYRRHRYVNALVRDPPPETPGKIARSSVNFILVEKRLLS
jgi:hypothetical protein